MLALQVCGFFRLPDDFKGSLADALRLMAEYHEKKGAKNPIRTISSPESCPVPVEIWTEFWKNCVDKTDCKITANLAVSELVGDEMVTLDYIK